MPAPTSSVSAELPPLVIEPGLNAAVAPAGTPVALSVMLSGEPLIAAVEMVEVALSPCTAETLVGLALIEKSFGGGLTASVTVVL